MAAGFGVVGYFFYKLGCEPAPLLLGFILGPMMEENLRRALLLSRGDWSTFVTRPLSAALLVGGGADGRGRHAAGDQEPARGRFPGRGLRAADGLPTLSGAAGRRRAAPGWRGR